MTHDRPRSGMQPASPALLRFLLLVAPPSFRPRRPNPWFEGERFIELRRRLLLQMSSDVAIRVCCNRNGRVPQALLHDLEVNALLKQQAGMRVAQ